MNIIIGVLVDYFIVEPILTFWYTARDSNPEPPGYKPDTLTIELAVLIKLLL